MVAALIISISLVLRLLQTNPDLTLSDLVGPKGKCGLPKPCPGNDYSFKVSSGATNIVGPRICFEGKILIEKDTRGNRQGINIVVINGKHVELEETGEHVSTGSFNMWNGKVEELIDFLKSIKDGSIVLIASFDDPATKLNDEARTLIADLGSAYISQLKFRDNWVFVGGKKTMAQISFEQHMKNERETNKYDSWPEMIEMEGCIPQMF
ncbi:Protein FAM3C [Labeo rohita]|uniref:Protein FAM3C n=1 Tax=Labeo rohita TaxID=84645 RepID=A0ABQ8LEK0_LABRO|nr:Protein FAM3C [Labeo rohita]